MWNQCQHQSQDSIHRRPWFVSGEIWKCHPLQAAERGRTITSDTYCQQFDCVNETCQTFPALVNKKWIIFQHDNTKTYFVEQSQEKIIRMGISASCLPDLVLIDFSHLFQSLECFITI